MIYSVLLSPMIPTGYNFNFQFSMINDEWSIFLWKIYFPKWKYMGICFLMFWYSSRDIYHCNHLMYSTVGQAVEMLDWCSIVMGSIPSDRYVASVRYLLDLMTFLQRPDTSPGSPLCFAPLPWYAAAHCCIHCHTADPIGSYLIWIFQDIIVVLTWICK